MRFKLPMRNPIVHSTFAVLLTIFTLSTEAQVDREKKSIRIPAVESPKPKDSALMPLKIKPNNIPELPAESSNNFNNLTERQKKFILKETEKPFSMFENDGLKDPGQLFVERWRQQAAKSGIIRVMDDQFLGQYNIDAKFVNVVCRDHEYPDGDRVQIVVNDEIVYRDIVLTSEYRRLKIDLIDGKNRIDIIALNQGTSGPNTAEFTVYDDQGNVVSTKEWNLLTGVKATIIFINRKPEITRNSDNH